MSGFNSFVVREYTPLTDGVLVLGLEFNEITIAVRDDRSLGDYEVSTNDRDDYQYNRYGYQGHRNSYDRNNFDRNYERQHYEDHRNSYRDSYDRNNYRDYRNQKRDQKREFRDYGIPLVESPQRRNSAGGVYREDRQVMQAYGVVMEYGYVSQSASVSSHDRPLTGVRINLSNVEFRCGV